MESHLELFIKHMTRWFFITIQSTWSFSYSGTSRTLSITQSPTWWSTTSRPWRSGKNVGQHVLAAVLIRLPKAPEKFAIRQAAFEMRLGEMKIQEELDRRYMERERELERMREAEHRRARERAGLWIANTPCKQSPLRYNGLAKLIAIASRA